MCTRAESVDDEGAPSGRLGRRETLGSLGAVGTYASLEGNPVDVKASLSFDRG